MFLYDHLKFKLFSQEKKRLYFKRCIIHTLEILNYRYCIFSRCHRVLKGCGFFTSKEKKFQNLFQLSCLGNTVGNEDTTHTYLLHSSREGQLAKVVKIPHRPIHMSFKGYIRGYYMTTVLLKNWCQPANFWPADNSSTGNQVLLK